MIERKWDIPDLDFAVAVAMPVRVKVDGRVGAQVSRVGDTVCVRFDGGVECFTASEVEEIQS